MTSDTPLLSILVVGWNAADDLKRCLESVLAHTRVDSMEVIVIDNGSSDDSVATVRAFEGVQVIANPENRGAAAARNQGVAEARGELVLILDSDTYVVDDVIGRAVAELHRRPEIAILACELRFPNGRRQYNAHRAMSIRHTLLKDLWLYKLLPAGDRARTLLGGYYDSDEEVVTDWLAGPFLLFRKRIFIEHGGFNEQLFPEDSEWGIRMTHNGQRTIFAPGLGFIYHTGGAGTLADPMRTMRVHHRTGMKAYRMLNGRLPAAGYWLAQLCGSSVRWSVYATAAKLRPGNDFYAAQAREYGRLVRVYLEMPFRR
jgi:GT2 family glycosyltransferase